MGLTTISNHIASFYKRCTTRVYALTLVMFLLKMHTFSHLALITKKDEEVQLALNPMRIRNNFNEQNITYCLI